MSRARQLKGRRIAVLAADGFERVELSVPVAALRAGASAATNFTNAAAHALLGCGVSVASGSDCKSGAMGAGAGALLSNFGYGLIKDLPRGGQIAAVAIVGGTASQLGGGKFANGAVTAAFGYIFNYIAAHDRGESADIYRLEFNAKGGSGTPAWLDELFDKAMSSRRCTVAGPLDCRYVVREHEREWSKANPKVGDNELKSPRARQAAVRLEPVLKEIATGLGIKSTRITRAQLEAFYGKVGSDPKWAIPFKDVYGERPDQALRRLDVLSGRIKPD